MRKSDRTFDLDGAVAQLRAWASGTPEVLSLAVFGSRVRGDHRVDSDLDLAIEVAGEGGELATLMANHDAWKAEIEKLLGFSPIHLTPREDVATTLTRGNVIEVFERPLKPFDFSDLLSIDETEPG